MKAVVITVPRETWTMNMSNHWHIVDIAISRTVVESIKSAYPAAEVIEREWHWQSETPDCPGCGERLVRST